MCLRSIYASNGVSRNFYCGNALKSENVCSGRSEIRVAEAWAAGALNNYSVSYDGSCAEPGGRALRAQNSEGKTF